MYCGKDIVLGRYRHGVRHMLYDGADWHGHEEEPLG